MGAFPAPRCAPYRSRVVRNRYHLQRVRRAALRRGWGFSQPPRRYPIPQMDAGAPRKALGAAAKDFQNVAGPRDT